MGQHYPLLCTISPSPFGVACRLEILSSCDLHACTRFMFWSNKRRFNYLMKYELGQVGVVGRTGAGKSSILNVLFRLNPICSGCILVDGLDINNIPVRDLRSSFAVVPQSPFLFEGSLRFDSTSYLGLSNLVNASHILVKLFQG